MSKSFIGRSLIAPVMLVMLAAAGLKVADIGAFRSALESEWLLPAPLATLMAILIPVLEVSLAAAWFLGLRRRVALVGAGLLLVGFTIAFVWLWIVKAPPDCGCFGKIKLFEQTQHAALWTVLRNLGLMITLFVGGILTWNEPAQSSGAGKVDPAHA